MLDKEVFERFAERLSYVQGDFATPRPTDESRRRSRAKESPVFYLEIPPFLFGTVVKGCRTPG